MRELTQRCLLSHSTVTAAQQTLAELVEGDPGAAAQQILAELVEGVRPAEEESADLPSEPYSGAIH